MEKKVRVSIVGATGMVGQRFATLLENHPWFTVSALAASPASAGKRYEDAVEGRWKVPAPIPEDLKDMVVRAAETEIESMKRDADFVFSAVDMEKDAVRRLEEAYAAAGLPVVSNNSAHRWTKDVPMVLPEINPHHLDMIPVQRKQRGWSKGLIVVKPNCSVQSYLPVLEALNAFEPERVIVTTFQAVSGAGRTVDTWPEMQDNVIPLIPGEEEKSEKEPMKIWGTIKSGAFVLAKSPIISANCVRVPVSDGHMAAVNITFKKKPSRENIIDAIRNFKNPLTTLHLPSAPEPFITYFDEADRPQTKLDRDLARGMGISAGRLREDPILGWKLMVLSHNTVRGAAGGAILTAELLKARGYL